MSHLCPSLVTHRDMPKPTYQMVINLGLNQFMMKKHAAILTYNTDYGDNTARYVPDLESYAVALGFSVACTVNATSRSDSERARAKLLELAGGGKIDAVLVTSLASLCLRINEIGDYLQKMQILGVSIISLRGLTFDMNSEHSRILIEGLKELSLIDKIVEEMTDKKICHPKKTRPYRLKETPSVTSGTLHRAGDIVEAVLRGKSYRAVAAEFGVSKNTVMKTIRLLQAGLICTKNMNLDEKARQKLQYIQFPICGNTKNQASPPATSLSLPVRSTK